MRDPQSSLHPSINRCVESAREKDPHMETYRRAQHLLEVVLRSQRSSPKAHKWYLIISINHQPLLPHLPNSVAMASSSASVTREEFNMFHSIDRELYAKLVHNLGRNPGQSMQVVALWLWLEQMGHGDNLVTNVLALPNSMINAIANETVTCLNCSDDHDKLMRLLSYDDNPIPLLQILTKGAISLRFFQENRIAVIGGVAKLVDEVCTRAFQDILQQTFQNNAGNVVVRDGIIGTPAHILDTEQRTSINLGNSSPLMMDPVPQPPSPLYYSGVGGVMDVGTSNGTDLHTPNGEVSQRLSPNPIDDLSAAEVRSVPPDERTIFLTFSKGYPISENEVKDFFTRKYGDFIEAIHMQEVNEATDQPLYARLVTRSPSSIEVVLEGNMKAKFSINGKHVWARKFFRKSSVSPRKSSSPPSSRPTSPPATQD